VLISVRPHDDATPPANRRCIAAKDISSTTNATRQMVRSGPPLHLSGANVEKLDSSVGVGENMHLHRSAIDAAFSVPAATWGELPVMIQIALESDVENLKSPIGIGSDIDRLAVIIVRLAVVIDEVCFAVPIGAAG
jgi:hypothetical protein